MKTLRNIVVVCVIVLLAIMLRPARDADRAKASTAAMPAAQRTRAALRAPAAPTLPLEANGAAQRSTEPDEPRVASTPAMPSLVPTPSIAQPAGRVLEAAKLPALQPDRAPAPPQPAGKQLRVLR
jgi:hypothetical protein